MAPVSSPPTRRVPARLAHVFGVALALIVAFGQPWGLTAADTKHDLVANPAGFLAGAREAWTDLFTLGQLQNQAYGYLFPQGAFFLLADPLPDWVAQRLWWALTLSLGFSGFLFLVRRASGRVGFTPLELLAATGYALSPRVLSTLTTISSETWPVMLAPWVLAPLVGTRLGRRPVALSLLAVGAMGAVNATATLAAVLPAGLYLAYRLALRPARRELLAGLGWLVGCLLLSLWWIVPLVVLGRYASPFTDYIESAGVTTRWLNLAEVLRGTTSWVPFVDAERRTGVLLVTEPVFVVFTLAVATFGLLGLRKLHARDGFWVFLLACGVLILGGAHLVTGFLDGAGAPLRNVHKFDPLVRIPLMMGIAALQPRLPQLHRPVAALVACCVLAASAPALTGRLLPQGAYEEVPQYWQEAADFLNENAASTRTLILPASSFARQEWGWTRDEPLQPLLEVPWAVRDAIPLVDPEAIRGLDGVSTHPTAAGLSRFGIGAVLLRHDLERGPRVDTRPLAEELGAQVHSFGEVDVLLFSPDLGMLLAEEPPTKVAGGGEALALLGDGVYQLVNQDAEIVTDTPALTARNYGTLGSVSAPLASREEATDVLNPVQDYPSAGPYTSVTGIGEARVSSSEADATSLGGSNPARSVTAAVDGDPGTAWYPQPGRQEGEWLELRADAARPRLELLGAGAPVDVRINSGDAHVDVRLEPGKRRVVEVPGGTTEAVRVTLGASTSRAGIAEAVLRDGSSQPLVTRVVRVPDSSPNVREFLFQKVFVDTEKVIRAFTAPREMHLEVHPTACHYPVEIDGATYRCGERVTLSAGSHKLRTEAPWVHLREPGFAATPALPLPLAERSPTRLAVDVPHSDTPRILATTRAQNPGLRATLHSDAGEVALEPVTVNAGTQGFVIPAGMGGRVDMHFAGAQAYRLDLYGGAALAILTALVCLLFAYRRPSQPLPPHPGGRATTLLMALAICAAAGLPGLLAGLLAWLARRYTLLSSGTLIAALGAIAASWLARAPWLSGGYAGDSILLAGVLSAALFILALPRKGDSTSS